MIPRAQVSTYDSRVTFKAAPIVGENAYCFCTEAPARYTGVGKIYRCRKAWHVTGYEIDVLQGRTDIPARS